ncbi:hypothetical protein R4036_004580, partial [Salmonella enterica]|nr:hypothetical protein [Salmonella enterica]
KTIKEREAQENYKQRVREITQSALDSLPVLEYPCLFDDELENVRNEWNKIVLKMSKQVDSFVQNENTMKWADIREQKLTIDAFQGASSRVWIVKQTLEQISDTESLLIDKGITEEQQQMIDTVKRCAVMWGRDVLRTDKNLIAGFTHPLIDVLEGAKAWGTYQDDVTNKQWLCVWNGKPPIQDMEKPFYDDSDAIRKFSIKEKWKAGDEQYIYWTRKEKAIYEEKQERIKQRNEILNQRKQAEQERQATAISRILEILDTDLSHITDYIDEQPTQLQPLLRNHFQQQLLKMDSMKQKLEAIQQSNSVNYDELESMYNIAVYRLDYVANPLSLFDIFKPDF